MVNSCPYAFFFATIVYIGHLNFFIQLSNPFDLILTLGGKAAVLGFLLISGISVGHSYLNSKTGYFKRRFLRIYPLYFFAVLATVFLQYFLGSPYQLTNITFVSAGWLTSVANFFFLQGFLSIPITYNGPLWSLSVEVFFYLLVPFLMRMPIRLIYFIIIISFASFQILHDYTLYGCIALVYAWPWLIGFLLSAKKKIHTALLFLLVGIILVNFNQHVTGEKLSWMTLSIVSAVIYWCIYMDKKTPRLITTIFNYLGELSYPLYVFHIPIYLVLFYLGVRNQWIYLVLLLVSIVPINYTLDHWLKRLLWKPLLNFISENLRIYVVALKQKVKSSSPFNSRF